MKNLIKNIQIDIVHNYYTILFNIQEKYNNYKYKINKNNN